MTLADYSLMAFTLLNGARAVAYVPQLIKIHRDPHGAAAVSVSTWMLFAAANLATAWYAMTGFNDQLTAYVFVVNGAGCLAVAGLTALKRMRHKHPEIATDGPRDIELSPAALN